jgi:hypothetical protein
MSVGNLHMILTNFLSAVRFRLLSSTALVSEGNGFTVTLNAEGVNLANGTTVGYTIDGINSNDITSALTGQFSLTNNSAQIPISSTENDDTLIFVLGDSGLGAKTIKRYSTDRKLSSPVLQETFNEIAGSSNLGMFFKPDGSRMWLQDATNDVFRQYSLTAAPSIDQWNLNTINPTVTTGSYGSTGGNHQGMWIDETGTILFQVDRDIQTILQDDIPAWNPLFPGTPARTLNISAATSLPSGITVSRDGTRAFVSSLSPTVVLEYSGTANQCNNWTLSHTLTVGFNASDVFVDPLLGTKMYISDDSGKVHVYKLLTPWDLSTSEFLATWDLTATFSNIYAVYVVEPAAEIFRITLDATDSIGNQTRSISHNVTVENKALPEEVYYGQMSNFQTESLYKFTVPLGITELSAVAVGGGGGGASGVNKDTSTNAASAGGGGGGGALAYGTFSVTPGEILYITVGSGGANQPASGAGAGRGNTGNPGTATYIRRDSFTGVPLLSAGGGGGGGVYDTIGPDGSGSILSSGAGRLGGGFGGNGGGHAKQRDGGRPSGGGGAAGYSGNGGAGAGYSAGTTQVITAASAGSGGGGAGGGRDGSVSDGGNVGIIAEGVSGAVSGQSATRNGSVGPIFAGGGGRGGSGWSSSTIPATTSGGQGYAGGQGAVRIIWGNINNTREYPSTNTGNFLV